MKVTIRKTELAGLLALQSASDRAQAALRDSVAEILSSYSLHPQSKIHIPDPQRNELDVTEPPAPGATP